MKQVRKMVTLLLVALLVFGTIPNTMAAESVAVFNGTFETENGELIGWTGSGEVITSDSDEYNPPTGYDKNYLKITAGDSSPIKVLVLPKEDAVNKHLRGMYQGTDAFVSFVYLDAWGTEKGKSGDKVLDSAATWTYFEMATPAASTIDAIEGVTHIGIRLRTAANTIADYADLSLVENLLPPLKLENWTANRATYLPTGSETGGPAVEMVLTSGYPEFLKYGLTTLAPGKMYKLSFNWKVSKIASNNMIFIRYNFDDSVNSVYEFRGQGGIYLNGVWAAGAGTTGIATPTTVNTWEKVTICFVAPEIRYTTANIIFKSNCGEEKNEQGEHETITISDLTLAEDVTNISLAKDDSSTLKDNEIVSNETITANLHFVPDKVSGSAAENALDVVAAVYKVEDGKKKQLCCIEIFPAQNPFSDFTPPAFTAYKFLLPTSLSLPINISELKSGNYEIKVMTWDEVGGMHPLGEYLVHPATYTAQ